jgi:glucose-6-phosphate dehydrogenase assembly protein OpcA
MSETTNASDAFLSGQGIPVDLRDVDSELVRLWGPAAEREGGPDLDHPTVTRLVLANLVAADMSSDPKRVDDLLEIVTGRYPCRAILLRRSDDTARKVSAEVSAVCHLPAPGMPQVCAERILLHAGTSALDLLPGAVLSLLETDLPVVLWWSGDPRPYESLYRDLATEASRVIPDLPDPGAEIDGLKLALDLTINTYSRDIAWFGISLWRELSAQFFDTQCAAELLPQISEIQISAVSPSSASTPRVSAWLAAWFAGQLGWTSKERKRQGDVLSATFNGPSGDIAVELATRVDASLPIPHVLGLTIKTTTGGEFRLTRASATAQEVRVDLNSSTHCSLPRVVHAPGWDAARRLAAAQESARDDPPYRHALPHMLWLIEA